MASIADGQDLYGCLFDSDSGRYAAKSLGKVTAVQGDSVTCAGLVFSLLLDHVYVTRADAERAADQRNAVSGLGPQPIQRDELPSAPEN